MASNGIHHQKVVKLLVINPNSSQPLTEGLDKMIRDLGYSEVTQVSTYTAPSGPDSINHEDDARASAEVVLEDLRYGNLLTGYDGLIVACYSVHPLTRKLRSIIQNRPHVPTIGIFGASISTSLSLLLPSDSADAKTYEKFGIVTTGKYWEKVLTDGVINFIGCQDLASCQRFKGVESTGLSAAELHTSPAEDVRSRMKNATKRLLRDRDVSVICLGCAGMAGMDAVVREGCVEELGAENGQRIHIVDGVKAAIAILDGLVRGRA